MSIDLGSNVSLETGILGASLNDRLLDLSLSVPIQPGIQIGGSVFIDLNNGGSIIGGSIDMSLFKYVKIEIGKKGCVEYITISIGISPPRNNNSSNGKGNNNNGKSNRNNRGNSRNNGKNDHGGRTNQNNRNRDKPPIRLGESAEIQESELTRFQNQENQNSLRDNENTTEDRSRNLQDNLQDRNRNLQDTVRDRIRDKPRE